MRQLIRRTLILACAVLLMGALAATASAATVDSGECGSNLTWALDQDGTLTIDGTGDMTDFNLYLNTPQYTDAPWHSLRTSVTGVIIESGITSIGENAFYGCNRIKSISIPNGVIEIGANAFYGCSSLADVSIPNSVTKIGSNAFYDCTSMMKISIGDGVTSIGNYAFFNCNSLADISIPDSVTNIGYAAFVGSGVTTINIPDSVIVIGDMAFFSCHSLTSVIIGDGVTSIGDNTFSYCDNLYTIIIGDSVASIGEDAFSYCDSLVSITIPNSTYRIDSCAFYACSNLSSITIGDNVSSIGNSAFWGCYNLVDFYVADVGSWLNIWFGNYESNPFYVNSKTKKLYINDKLVTDLIVPDSISEIPDYAFSYCTSLTSISIPKEVTSIGANAFACCNKIEAIYFGGTADQWEALGSYKPSASYIHYESTDPISHWIVDEKEATCEDAGYNREICVCGYEKNKVTIPALTHDMGKWMPDGNDQERRDCSRCDYYETREIEKLAAPTLKASNDAATGKPVISWSKVDGAAKYELYQATSKTGTYKKIGTTTSTSITNKSAETGKMYYYKVRAIATNGTASDYSSAVNRTCDLPHPVVKVGNVADTGKVRLTWTAIDGAAKYEVYRATSENGTYSRLGTTNRTTYTNGGSEVGKTYYYKVRALHGTNTSAHSAYSAIVARTGDLPQPVVKVGNVASTGKVRLTWTAIDGAAKYEVYRATSENGTYSRLGTTSGTTYTNGGSEAGKTYYYKVRAIHSNSSANSAYSAVVGRTCALPQVTGLKATNVTSTGKIKLSWNKVDGAAKYQIVRSLDKTNWEHLTYTTGTSATNTKTDAGKTYYYKVRAVHSDSAATSAYSAVVSRTCDLAQPTLTVKLNSNGKPTLSWTKVTGAVKYQIMCSTDNKNWEHLTYTTNTSATNTKAVAGTKYYYKVRAIHSNSAATSAYSAVKYITAK